MIFWILITLICLIVAGLLGRALWRGPQAVGTAGEFDLQIYRDQLEDVERDLARGVLNEEEADRVRTEVSRRILAADALCQTEAEPAPRQSGRIMIALVSLVLLGGTGLLYTQLGAPGYVDLPIKARIAASDEQRANRLTQDKAEERMNGIPSAPTPQATPEFLDLMEKLRKTVETRPDDLQGLELLVRNEAALGHADAAHAAQARVIALKGADAMARDHALYADLLITAAGGYVSTEAENALRAGLAKDPKHPIALYYLAQYLLQVDRPDAAFPIMEGLLRDSPANAPWLGSLREQIEAVAWSAGVDYTLPPLTKAPGPDADAIAAAEDMTDADRQAMIQGMVTQLSDRLATQGGTAQEWARLIRALGVLGDTDQAALIYGEAQSVFEGRPAELQQILAAAQDAGVAQ